ncbi:MAG: 6-carboxytetrahydropterin synthase [Phycisphaerales bacterium]|nr:6-carboxytetrahydropterin synthase [Phycisphaerales bacterium]
MSTHEVELTRTVRCCIPLDETTWTNQPRNNTFAGWPSMTGIGLYAELDVTVRGRPDPTTGYLVGIQDIDALVRSRALPILSRTVRERPTTPAECALREMARACIDHTDLPIVRFGWRLTPFYRLELETASMTADPTTEPATVLYRQQFEFAAAHRLHCDDLSDDENRRIFGKCNNRNGHGHNYRLEVIVEAPLTDRPAFGLGRLEAIVREHVVDRFDHTNLSLDVEEFADCNPSVEHIARVCHDRLINPLRDAGAALRNVTVWETEKTACTYPP